MEGIRYGGRREGRWTPIRAKAQDTRANPNSWETHLVRKRWDIGLLRALSPRIMMMMMMMTARDNIITRMMTGVTDIILVFQPLLEADLYYRSTICSCLPVFVNVVHFSANFKFLKNEN